MECISCKRTIDQIIEQDGAVEFSSLEPFMCNTCKRIVEHKQWLSNIRKMFDVDKLEEENKQLKEALKIACE